MEKTKKLDLVLIEWIDACTTNTKWKNINDVSGIVKCYSTGFLVKKTKEYIILFPNICGVNDISGCCDFTIPIGSIIKIKKIKY